MISPVRRAAILAILCVGCSSGGNSTADDGPPNLARWTALGSDGSEVDLLAPAAMPISPVSRFKLVFDHLLDGDKIETVDHDKVTPRTDVASITWMDAPA